MDAILEGLHSAAMQCRHCDAIRALVGRVKEAVEYAAGQANDYSDGGAVADNILTLLDEVPS